VSDARRHHYNPRCWLAGFTLEGTQEARLFVTDLRRRKQWMSTPSGSAHERDFYRLVETVNFDPLLFEKWLGRIESDAAPVFRELDRHPDRLTLDHQETLLCFIASQWIRTPAYRAWLLEVAQAFHKSEMEKVLETRETWLSGLKEAGLNPDHPGAEYHRMKEFIERGAYTLSAENDWFVNRGLQMFEKLVAELRDRYWHPIISENGNFIASDSPVLMDGPQGEMIGFKSAEAVVFTVTRHVILVGAQQPFRWGRVNRRAIARHNTFAIVNATAQVYSPVAEFCWADANDEYRTDWRLYSESKIRQTRPVPFFTDAFALV
jgi:Protein of unknown function (DUF4238)